VPCPRRSRRRRAGKNRYSARATAWPTFHNASWLNQIEIWFSILGGKSLNGASFHSVEELMTHINSFIADYNETARPFVWKPCFDDQ
jgi:hypothetical protein